MSISTSLLRLVEYQSRHGFRATLRRAGIAAKRAVFAGDMVVFYCDLDAIKFRPVKIPAGFSIQRLESLRDLSSTDFEQVTAFWNPKLASANIRERFKNGAVLWLVKSGESVAAYGWTLRGRSIEPYYFPLGTDDVQLFDFYVAPQFRGRALHWLLTSYLLHALAAEGSTRAFADTGEWNEAQLASFRMTNFRLLGRVRALRIFGRLLTHWKTNDPAEETASTVAQTAHITRVLRSNE
jgi:ribosomal protein S18 acetylase RimI-like enzyme